MFKYCFLLLAYFACLLACSPVEKIQKRANLLKSAIKWKNNVLPYVIDWSTYNNNYTFISIIENSIKNMEQQLNGCIRIIPRTYESEYIIIRGKPGSGCNSHIGVQKVQPQIVNLEPPGCVNKNVLSHELTHALGFQHEQQRPDLLDWMEILWENVEEKCKKNLQDFISSVSIWEKDNYDTIGEPYDYYSLMHYGMIYNECSKNGKAYWRPKVPGVDIYKVGNGMYHDGLSQGDIRMIKKVYNCPL